MKTKLAIASLIALSFWSVVTLQNHRNHALLNSLNQKDAELSSTKSELKRVKAVLADTQKKLAFIDQNHTTVQVTAYAPSPNARFANGRKVSHAYAVRRRTLPNDRVISIALSLSAQHRLHARLNDLIVLVHRRNHTKTLARFVDITSAGENRPVVDVYFADERQAWLWGRRKDFYAVNISSANSPFRGVLSRYEGSSFAR